MKSHSFRDAAKSWKSHRNRRVIPTGIAPLDEALGGGLPVRQITTLGAYTGHRKSELARQISKRVMAHGYRVLTIDIELGEDRIFERFYVQESGLPLKQLVEEMYANVEEEHAAEEAMESLVHNKLFSVYSPGNMPPLEELLKTVRADLAAGQEKSKEPVLVIFDSVQRLALGQSSPSVREGMVFFMGEMENFARNHNVAVLAISEGGRPKQGKQMRRLKMTDLAESRAIEYVSDVVMLLNPVKEKRAPNEFAVEIDIGKNRPKGFEDTVPGALVFTKPCWGMIVESAEERSKVKTENGVVDIKKKVLSFLTGNPKISLDDAAVKLHIRRKTIGRTSRELMAEKKLARTKSGWLNIAALTNENAEGSEQEENAALCKD
jgi:replicative DNA helicase